MSPLWKQAAVVLLAMMVTGATAWLTFGGDKVTEGQLRDSKIELQQHVADQIAKASAESDYSRDKALIRDQLDSLRSTVGTLAQQVQAVIRTQSDAAADQKIANAKLDTLSAQVGAINSKLDEALRRDGK